ncbi:MAG TPA: 2OG-Fe(II) oxygenase [Herbaspirillum sp.]|jgi:hypothetical protein
MKAHPLKLAATPISIDSLDWTDLAAQLDQEGYALLPGLLEKERAQALALLASDMATGSADLFHPARTPPAELASWRQAFYPHLMPIANRWNRTMGNKTQYPATFEAFQTMQKQSRPTCPQNARAVFTCLHEGERQPLHQTLGSERDFLLQIVILLSKPGRDFSGGEFAMTEQRPRMQTRPMVLPLRQGDAAIIAAAHRPCKGNNGYYRVNLKHAISRVRSGQRAGLELVFDDGH